MNPMEMIKTLIGRGMNPQQVFSNMFSNMSNQNPIVNNLIGMMNSGNKQGVETFARNIFKEQGRNFDEEFSSFMKNIKG